VSDTSRDPDDDDAPTGEISIGRAASASADAPVSGAPAGGAPAGGGFGPGSADAGGPGSADTSGPRSSDASGSGLGDAGGPRSADAGGSTSADAGGQGSGGAATTAPKPAARRRLLSFGPLPADPGDPRQRRRRRWFITGIAVAAVIVVVALCTGALSVVSAVNGVRDRAADVRAARTLRENDCLDLEKRLNRLIPPGSTTGPAARATAVRDENAAVRIYVGQLDTQRDEDAWRQLLDARTVFADALDRQAKSRTPAFYVAPRTDNGLAVADQLMEWSPEQCAGAIRRLAAPEL
jgi:hypothetical protein